MQTSDTIVKISAAFLAAQKQIDSAVKGTANSYFKSKYADMNAVIDACKKALNDQKISVLQPVMGDVVETYLIHESGEWFKSETPIISKAEHDPQAYGSAITYARRYGVQAFVFMGAEDDDGEGAMSRPAETATGAKTAAKPQSANTVLCGVHHTEMKLTARGTHAHMRNNMNTRAVEWCNGKGFPGEVMIPKAATPETPDEGYEDVSDEITF